MPKPTNAEVYAAFIAVLGMAMTYWSYSLARLRTDYKKRVAEAVERLIDSAEEQIRSDADPKRPQVLTDWEGISKIIEAIPEEDRLPLLYAAFGVGLIALSTVVAGFVSITGTAGP